MREWRLFYQSKGKGYNILVGEGEKKAAFTGPRRKRKP